MLTYLIFFTDLKKKRVSLKKFVKRPIYIEFVPVCCTLFHLANIMKYLHSCFIEKLVLFVFFQEILVVNFAFFVIQI